MALFWYPEINDKYQFDGKPDKALLMSEYTRYFLDRLQSMFIYEGLPDSVPQKWLEVILMSKGYGVWIMNGDELLFTGDVGIGGEPDAYHIPTKCIVTNPYIPAEYGDRTYTRDVDCVFMPNDTLCVGMLPIIKKYASMLIENEITMNIADIMTRASLILSAADDNTKANAELFLKRLFEGTLGVIGEAPFLVGNQDRAFSVDQLSGAGQSLTNLIEYQQYIKASFYNDIGLQSNYNMKREAINSNESQLNEDMLHPFIDDMLKERQEALEKVNAMFGTNISVKFNSAWEINEREEEAAIETIENEAEADGTPEDMTTEEVSDEVTETPDTEDQIEGEEAEAVEVTITEEAIEEIAEAVAEKVEGEDNEENT